MALAVAACTPRPAVPPEAVDTPDRLRLAPLHGLSPALDRLDQRHGPLDGRVRRAWTGRGVVVYVFDAGLDTTHPELHGRARGGFDAFPGEPLRSSHGTAVASLIAGRTLGVAPEADVVSVRVVRAGTLGDLRQLAAGARWVVADARRHGRPSLANWSLHAGTYGVESADVLDAIGTLDAAGILIVTAAGNSSLDPCTWVTARDPRTFTVGASRLPEVGGGLAAMRRGAAQDRRMPHTGDGLCVDLFAPGEDVPTAAPASAPPGVVAWRSGTSFATPLATGVAALLLERTPGLTPGALRQQLRDLAAPDIVAGTTAPGARLLQLP